MKAIIPKNKLRKSSIIIDNDSLEHSERTMRHTWSEFSDALARKDFEYTHTDKALAVTFLKQFDRWFQGIGKAEMSITISDFFNDKYIGRGTIIPCLRFSCNGMMIANQFHSGAVTNMLLQKPLNVIRS